MAPSFPSPPRGPRGPCCTWSRTRFAPSAFPRGGGARPAWGRGEEVRERLPRLLTLLLVAAGLEVSSRSLPPGFGPEAALAIALLIAARLDMAGAVAIAAVLVRKGFDPGMAVALVAIGPMLS